MWLSEVLLAIASVMVILLGRWYLNRRLYAWYWADKVGFDFWLLAFAEYRTLWRSRVHLRRIARWWLSVWRGGNAWWRRIRPLLMGAAGLASLMFFNWVFNDKSWSIELAGIKSNAVGETAKGIWTLIIAIISAPVAFAVWWFRDSNQRQQLENQRKDTNLKDFQQLTQWASGLHFGEHKFDSSKSDKEAINKPINLYVPDSVKLNQDSNLYSKDKLKINKNIESHSFDKQLGSASLQMASIYQLQSFLRGDYGKYFQQPAFALLKSLWSELVQHHFKAWPRSLIEDIETYAYTYTNAYELIAQNDRYKAWHDGIKSSMSNSLMQAIARSLVHNSGAALRKHERDLARSNFLGLNAKSSEREIELEGCNLSYSNWQCASLQGAFLEGANFSGAHLQGADMSGAYLEGVGMHGSHLTMARLIEANLDNVNLSLAEMSGVDAQYARFFKANMISTCLICSNLGNANLQGSDMTGARLQGANMVEANLEYADLTSARLDNVDLSYVRLKGTNFMDSHLEGAVFINPVIDDVTNSDGASTNFTDACTSNDTKVLMTSGNLTYLGAKAFWDDGDHTKFNEKKSLELRKRLRDENNLVLPDIAYKEL